MKTIEPAPLESLRGLLLGEHYALVLSEYYDITLEAHQLL